MEPEEVKAYTETKDKVDKLLQDLTDGKVLDGSALEAITQNFEEELDSNHTIMGCVKIGRAHV